MKKLLSFALCFCMILSLATTGAFAASAESYLGDANNLTENIAGNTDVAGEEAPADAVNGNLVGTADVPVYIETETNETVTNVYAVSYDVSELTFKYSEDVDIIWNPETTEYESTAVGEWEASSQNITVSNYSDIPVLVTPSNTDTVDDGVTIELGSALALDSAYNEDDVVVGDASKASVKSGTISVTVDGEPDARYDTKTLLSTVTLTVTDNR